MIPPFDLFRIENDRLLRQGTAEALDVARLHRSSTGLVVKKSSKLYHWYINTCSVFAKQL
jgi:hypothetical protein